MTTEAGAGQVAEALPRVDILVNNLGVFGSADPLEITDDEWRRYFEVGAEKFGWSRRHPTGDPASGPVKRGMGCAANRWGGGGRGTRASLEFEA